MSDTRAGRRGLERPSLSGISSRACCCFCISSSPHHPRAVLVIVPRIKGMGVGILFFVALAERIHSHSHTNTHSHASERLSRGRKKCRKRETGEENGKRETRNTHHFVSSFVSFCRFVRVFFFFAFACMSARQERGCTHCWRRSQHVWHEKSHLKSV